MFKDLIAYLQSRIEYYERQNIVISNQERTSADDYKWMARNNKQISDIQKWIRMLGKGE